MTILGKIREFNSKYVAPVALSAYLAACTGSPSAPSTTQPPTPAKTYAVDIDLYDTFTQQPIQGFNYNLCAGDKTAAGNHIHEVVNEGSCTWKFSGGNIEIPREIITNVNRDASVNVYAIKTGTNFPIQHYRDIIPIVDRSDGGINKMMERNVVVYNVTDFRANDTRNNAGVIMEMTAGSPQSYTSRYDGVINETLTSPQSGTIYVRWVDSISGNRAGRPIPHQIGSVVNWCEVEVLKGVPINSLAHELIRCIGFFGNATTRNSILYPAGNPTHPSPDDIKAGQLFSMREPNHKISSTSDTDSLTLR